MINIVTIIRNYGVDFSNEVDGMKDNLSLSVGNTIEFQYKKIHNYLIKKRWIFFNCLLTAMSNLGGDIDVT